MNISAKTKLCMVIGDPVAHSLSPIMHNAGYVALGLQAEFTYQARLVKPEELADFVPSIRTENIRGVNCKAPHKIAALQYLDEIDPVAQRIGAVNAIVNDAGVLKGYNTDWLGILAPLEQFGNLANKKVALIGAGGAARAAAYALNERQAILTIYNRTLSKAEDLAREFGGQAEPLEVLQAIRDADIIINAITHDQTTAEQQLSALYEFIHAGQIVFDIDYGQQTDAFLRQVEQHGAQTLDGLEMVLQQGMPAFKLFTGHVAPEAAMRAAILQAVQTEGAR
jgi:shikimate dehydrogenase